MKTKMIAFLMVLLLIVLAGCNNTPSNEDIKEREMIEIIAGDFFICYAPISSEKFLSLTPDLEKKYAEKFRYPETFVRTDDGIKAIPYKPKTKDFER